MNKNNKEKLNEEQKEKDSCLFLYISVALIIIAMVLSIFIPDYLGNEGIWHRAWK